MRAIRTFLTITLLLGLALTGKTSFAQAPSGSITNRIVGSTNALWDASLFGGLQSPFLSIGMSAKLATNYWKCLQGQATPATAVPGTNLELQVNYTGPYTQDGGGRFSGKGSNTLSLSYVSLLDWWSSTNVLDLTNVPGKYVVSGSINGFGGGMSVLRFMSSASGVLPLSGKPLRVSATQAFYVTVHSVNQLLYESYGYKIGLTGQRAVQTGGTDQESIPSGLGDGTWTLVLNFDATSPQAPTRLSGKATVTLNSGAVYPFHFTGRYSPKTGQSALLLKGVNDELGTGKGATLSVTLANGQIVKLLGRVAGQVISRK